MMCMADELVYNPFYIALQGKYKKKFEIAQEKCYLLCVPLSESFPKQAINEEFIDTHILKPSPFFKGQFICSDSKESKVVELEDGALKSLSGFKSNFNIKILSEERGYNKKCESYVILVVEKPFEIPGEVNASGSQTSESIVCQTIRKLNLENKGISHKDAKKILKTCCSDDAIQSLDQKLENFNCNYVLLPGYLDNAKDKLCSISKAGCQRAAKSLHDGVASDARIWNLLAEAVESYVLGCVYDKLFAVIADKYWDEDALVAKKLAEIYNQHITAEQLGANKALSCSLPAAVVELATIEGLTTPAEKAQCMKNTIDLITAEIKQFLQETHGSLTPAEMLPCLMADDLIPILLTVIAQAKLSRLASNVFYIENFQWSHSPRDELSYSLVTFKATMEFAKSIDSSKLNPSTNSLKKELSLEELMEVTERLQVKENEIPLSNKTEENKYWTPVDRQLDKITRMIEASTRELTAVQQQGILKKT